MRRPKVIKEPFQDEKNKWCWPGRGNRIWKHEERKIETQLEQVVLHQKRNLFPYETRKKKTKLGRGTGGFGRWSKNPLWASTFSAQSEAKSIPNGEGRGIGIEGLKREEKPCMSFWVEQRRAPLGKHVFSCRVEHLTQVMQVLDHEFLVAQSAMCKCAQ